MQNGFVESFNGRMRDELLNETLFFDLDDARTRIAAWITDYNDERPHSALGYLTPAAYAATFTATGDRLRPPPASPIARCSTYAERRTNRRGANCSWMKVKWQVSVGSAPLPLQPAPSDSRY